MAKKKILLSDEERRKVLRDSPEIKFTIIWGIKFEQPLCCLEYHVKCLVVGLDAVKEGGVMGDNYMTCPSCVAAEAKLLEGEAFQV